MAAHFLALCGYRIVERNFRFHRREIDIIARIDDVLVVVEVKYRGSGRRGGAVAGVGRSKQRELEVAAAGYLKARGIRGLRARFDVVTIDQATARSVTVRHIPNAFPARGLYHV
jgi:putative endonuclease